MCDHDSILQNQLTNQIIFKVIQNQLQNKIGHMHPYKKIREKDSKGSTSSKEKKKKQYEIQNYQGDVEHIARSNLCELSQNICERIMQKGKISISEFNQQDYSPWLNKQEQYSTDQNTKIKTKIKLIEDKGLKYQKSRERVISNYEKENINTSKIYKQEEEYQIQKYPSIFMRIKAAKQTKKQQKPETQIVTIMIKRKCHQHNDLSDINKIILSQKIENHSQNLRMFSNKISDLQSMKRKKSLSNIKHISSKHIELSSEQMQKDLSVHKSLKLSSQHWKGRRISLRNKKQKNVYFVRQTKSLDRRRQSKQNKSIFSRKKSVSLQKGIKEQIFSKNQHNRQLYNKNINTLYINHQSQQQKHHRI